MTSLFRVFYAIEQIQNFFEQRALKCGAVFLDTTVSMRQIHGTISSKIMNFRQIKALQRPGMAHRLVDRRVLRHISNMNLHSSMT